MTQPSTGADSGTPHDEGDGHGTPSKQHGDPLLAAAQGRDEGDGSRQGPSPEGGEPPAAG